jgi:hypothetical protein
MAVPCTPARCTTLSSSVLSTPAAGAGDFRALLEQDRHPQLESCMPRSKQPQVSQSRKSSARRNEHDAPEPGAQDRADALFRAAFECCRQHERYARVVTSQCDDGEESAVSRVVGLCDEQLRAAVKAYESVAVRPERGTEDEWWRRANALWLASREWVRRHEMCDDASKKLSRHTPEKLNELAVEYDLEASALLALRHAIDAYRKVRPEAELNGRVRH